ncbi:hypothetical protein Fleli_0786 [Bernardetia litoralis DSM 6794]|uniref:Cytochrome c n=1 Tax=Bernardetia litoralis (strain ATCC 23117 / DSM 6794 / NBRC 15988 / NCIMB 1366 / Fx l1 / Sio-4) TaxID=880071 RepID=I4AH11_BERLS|nr:hypothetical protein [Bernardetia litoralis]AFM03246.1 hypothetical protein Fleli_0786 [Bernardetia litoralis DSM 6794]
MKKLFLIPLIICFISCQSSQNEGKENTETTQNKEDKNATNLINDPRSPNPSSELAVLMRDMWEYADTLKNEIADSTSNNALPNYQTRFKEIHAAIPTDKHTKSPAFDAMTKVMLQKLENVYQNAAENKEQNEQVEGFNLLIKSCLQCHEQQCPGPISKISKLIIKK